MNNTKASKKISASKKGLIVIFGSAILTTITIVVLTIQGTSDLTVLGDVCTALWTAAQAFINDMADKYGIENITPIVQSILED